MREKAELEFPNLGNSIRVPRLLQSLLRQPSMRKSRHSKQYARFLTVLRESRIAAGLTQTEVAEHFGAHASFVSKCEAGERRVDVVELAQFCQLYGIKLGEFLATSGLE